MHRRQQALVVLAKARSLLAADCAGNLRTGLIKASESSGPQQLSPVPHGLSASNAAWTAWTAGTAAAVSPLHSRSCATVCQQGLAGSVASFASMPYSMASAEDAEQPSDRKPRMGPGRPKGSGGVQQRRRTQQQLSGQEHKPPPIKAEVHALADLLNVPDSKRANWVRAITRNRPSATVERAQRALGLLEQLLPHATPAQLRTAVRRHHVVIGSFMQNAKPNIQQLQERLNLDRPAAEAVALRHLGLLLSTPSTLGSRISAMLALLAPLLGQASAAEVLRATPQLLAMRERTIAAKWAAITARPEHREQCLGLEPSTVGQLLRYSAKRFARLQYLAAAASEADAAAAPGTAAAGGAAAGRMAGPTDGKATAALAAAAGLATPMSEQRLASILMVRDYEFATRHPQFDTWLRQQKPESLDVQEAQQLAEEQRAT